MTEHVHTRLSSRYLIAKNRNYPDRITVTQICKCGAYRKISGKLQIRYKGEWRKPTIRNPKIDFSEEEEWINR